MKYLPCELLYDGGIAGKKKKNNNKEKQQQTNQRSNVSTADNIADKNTHSAIMANSETTSHIGFFKCWRNEKLNEINQLFHNEA